MASKNGLLRKMPWGTLEKTSSHRPLSFSGVTSGVPVAHNASTALTARSIRSLYCSPVVGLNPCPRSSVAPKWKMAALSLLTSSPNVLPKAGVGMRSTSSSVAARSFRLHGLQRWHQGIARG